MLFYVNQDRQDDVMNRTPNILIFDSGIGGISVYNEVRQKIPSANYFYLFDNQAFPYGDKSSEFLVERVNKVIAAALKLYSFDLIVIACNTASTICLPSLRQSFLIPIVGVVPAMINFMTDIKTKPSNTLPTIDIADLNKKLDISAE